tara:strand:- start:385 stop:612 length:228 start_codon:yes stop_codon:yes gene_type:complete
MAKFRAIVPIYKTITGEIVYTFEAENLEQALEIFEKAVENNVVDSQDWNVEIHEEIDEESHDYDDKLIDKIIEYY